MDHIHTHKQTHTHTHTQKKTQKSCTHTQTGSHSQEERLNTTTQEHRHRFTQENKKTQKLCLHSQMISRKLTMYIHTKKVGALTNKLTHIVNSSTNKQIYNDIEKSQAKKQTSKNTKILLYSQVSSHKL